MLPSSDYDQSSISGFAAFDELSLDRDESVYVDDFMFLFPTEFNYPELDDQLDGVIGLNRFGFELKGKFGLTHGMQGKTNFIKALCDNFVIRE